MRSGLKILLLEDNKDDVTIIEKLLQKIDPGCELLTATSRREFIKELHKFKPDVILSGASLPQFNGTTALKLAKQHFPHVPFILVTKAISEEFAATIIKAGADDYVLKDRLARLPVSIKAALKQKKTEKEKWEVEQKNNFQAELLNTIGQAVLATDMEGVIKYWNKSAEAIYGWTGDEAIGKNAIDLIPNQKTKKQEAEISTELSRGNCWSGEFIVCRKDGKTFPIHNTDAPTYDKHKNLSGIISVSTIITKRKKAEKHLKDLNNQLHSLSGHLQTVREEERIQLANGIHDDLGQQIAVLKMKVSYFLKKIGPCDDPFIYETGIDILSLIDETAVSVRRILSSLRPSILDDVGLIAALEWHSEEIEKQSGITIIFIAGNNKLNLPNAISTALFRIYQEALSNIVMYAKARVVISKLQMNNKDLVLEIKDDGITLDPIKKNHKQELGFFSVQERIFLLGGKFKRKEVAGQGTTINIIVPL